MTSKEKSGFHNFLVNKGKKEDALTKAYCYITALKPKQFSELETDIMLAYPFIFPDSKEGVKNKDPQRDMLNILSDLFKELRHYFMGAAADDNDWIVQLRWLEFLRNRGIKKEYGTQLAALYHTVKTHYHKSALDCAKGLLVAQSYRQYLFGMLEHLEPATLQDCIDTINSLSDAMYLQSQSDKVNLVKMNPEPKGKKKKSPPTVDPVPEPPPTGFPLLEIQRAINSLMLTREISHYKSAKTLFTQYSKDLDSNEMHTILRYLRNFAAELIQTKKMSTELYSELHHLNVAADNNNLFLQEGVLLNGNMGSIVNIACATEQVEWTHQFIAKHESFLPLEHRDRLMNLCRAIIDFKQNQFEQVISLIGNGQYYYINDVITSKLLLLRSAYELGENIKVIDQCTSLKRILAKKGTTNTITSALTFARILKMMAEQKQPKLVILKEIENAGRIYYTDWLMAKLDKYINRYANLTQY